MEDDDNWSNGLPPPAFEMGLSLSLGDADSADLTSMKHAGLAHGELMREVCDGSHPASLSPTSDRSRQSTAGSSQPFWVILLAGHSRPGG
jgi:hypothetical protein